MARVAVDRVVSKMGYHYSIQSLARKRDIQVWKGAWITKSCKLCLQWNEKGSGRVRGKVLFICFCFLY